MNHKLRYYVGANTAEGFVNFLPTNVNNFNHVIILNHPSHRLKTTIIQQVINEYEQDHELEVLLSPLGNEYLDGVIVRNKSVAVISNTLSTKELTGAIEMDLNLFSGEEIPNNDMYKQVEQQVKHHTERAYQDFETGLKIHDDLEEIYINEMNFERANDLANEFIASLLKDIPATSKEGKVHERLFGTNTKDGVVNVVPELLEGITTNYFIKGRAGTGKSTFMKKIKNACQEHGFDVELYHCSFDPKSIDMVMVRELDFCIFDSTDPHEFFPEREGDQILDLYEELVTPGTDEKYAKDIDVLNKQYKSYMKRGIVELNEAGKHLSEKESQFVFTQQEIDRMTAFIFDKIIQ